MSVLVTDVTIGDRPGRAVRIADGRMYVPARPGLGFSLSDRARALTIETTTVGR